MTSVVHSDHKTIIAFADFQRVTGKKTLKKVYQKITPAQHAKFLNCISTLEFKSSQPDIQKEFDTSYDVVL